MGFPVELAQVPVFRRYYKYRNDGAPVAGGQISLRLQTAAVIGDTELVPRVLLVTLDATGRVPEGLTLPASNDPDLSPSGISYLVQEHWDGGRSGLLAVPYDAGEVDLADLQDNIPPPSPTNPYLRESDIGETVASQTALEAAQQAASDAQDDATAAMGAATAAQEAVAGLTKADLGLGNVDNTADANKPVSGPQQAALDEKAPLASPAFTGVPTADTAPLGTNSNQLATMAALAEAIANLIASAPGTLDTLKELADALGDDPNFAATMTQALAQKQPLAAFLTNLVALGRAADKLPYCTGTDTVGLADFTAFARTLLDDPDAATALATLGAIAASTKGAANGVAPLNSAARLDPIYRAKKRATVAPVGTVLTLDLSALDDAYIPLTGNVTSTVVTNPPPDGYARELLLVFGQDGTGGRTWTPPAGTKWPNGLAAVLTSTAGAVDHMALRVYNNGGVLEYTAYPVRDVR